MPLRNQAAKATLLLTALLFLTSCGKPTKREISFAGDLRDRVEAFEIEMSGISSAFDYEAEPYELVAPLDPLPRTAAGIYAARDYNTLLLSNFQLIGIMSREKFTDEDHLNLNINSWVPDLLQSIYASEPAEDGWQERVEAILNIRYVVVVAPYGYEPPKLFEDHYEGGIASVIVEVYDREAKRFILRFKVQDHAAGVVQAKTEKYRMDDALTFEVNEVLRDKLRLKIHERLAKETGGSFAWPLRQPPPADGDGDALYAPKGEETEGTFEGS